MLRAIVGAVIVTASGCFGVVTASPATACPEGTYQGSSDCVPSPTTAPSPPAGETALCNDGTYSFSEHRSGTCSHHGGVAQWLAGAPAPALSAPPAAAMPPTNNSDAFVALAISPNTGRIGWGTAGTQDRANQIAATECGSASGDVCVVAAGMQNGCAAIALGSGLFAGGYGPTTMAAIQDASARLPGGRIAGVQCSS
jgi:hypothetical protein